MRQTKKAREIAYKQWEKLEEERGEELYDYIEANPFQGVKELAEKLAIPRATLQVLLKKFIEDGLLIEEKKVVNGRVKNLYKIRTFEEHDFTDPSPILVNATIIENLFATHGVPKVSPEALQTFNTLLAEVTRKVIVGTSMKYQAEKIAGELSKQKIHQYFRELITFTPDISDML